MMQYQLKNNKNKNIPSSKMISIDGGFKLIQYLHINLTKIVVNSTEISKDQKIKSCFKSKF